MNHVGIDLQKKTLSIWVVKQERQKVNHKRLACSTSLKAIQRGALGQARRSSREARSP